MERPTNGIASLELISGLTPKKTDDNFRISYDGDDLLIVEKTGFLKNKEAQTFCLALNKIISMDIITKENIEEKQKSVVGRGVAGALLFGPAGAIVGGISGTGTKKTKKSESVLVISYYGKNEEDIKTINFGILGDLLDHEVQFVQYFKETYTDELTENENGEIIL